MSKKINSYSLTHGETSNELPAEGVKLFGVKHVADWCQQLQCSTLSYVVLTARAAEEVYNKTIDRSIKAFSANTALHK